MTQVVPYTSAAGAQAAPPVQTAPSITFPRTGLAYAFRQLQGTGQVTFKYASLDKTARRNDVLLALVLASLIAIFTWRSGWIFSSARRVVKAVLVVSLAAVCFGVALDAAIPLLVACVLILRLPSKNT